MRTEQDPIPSPEEEDSGSNDTAPKPKGEGSSIEKGKRIDHVLGARSAGKVRMSRRVAHLGRVTK